MGESIKELKEKYLEKFNIDMHKVKKNYGAIPQSRYNLFHVKGNDIDTIQIRDGNNVIKEDLEMTFNEFITDEFFQKKDSGKGREGRDE